ncbi:MAG: hypothetical protein U0165_17015 [Polyangiaceae bacterium]
MTSSGDPRGSADAPGVELRTHFLVAGSSGQAQTALSLWKGELGLPDWLRIEARDGRVLELRLEPRGLLRVGRFKVGMAEPPQVADDLFISSQAAILRHDGVRWWLRRRRECHERVPTVVGARVLAVDEEAPLVHGTFLQIGQARATLVDRRYVTPAVPAGAVDPVTGLLGKVGFAHEIGGLISLGRRGHIALVAFSPTSSASSSSAPSPIAFAVQAIHDAWPRLAVLHDDGTCALLIPEGSAALADVEATLRAIIKQRGLVAATGFWALGAKAHDPVVELDGALAAIRQALESGRIDTALDLRALPSTSPSSADRELIDVASQGRRAALLFGIEETGALQRVGPHVIPTLEQELLSLVASRAGAKSVVARLASGVVGALPAQSLDLESFAADLHREWLARPAIVDGKIELPRALCWETYVGDPSQRAVELSRECAEPSGVLTALSAPLPYPIAARVALASASMSAVERVKLLFDVLEGAWRMVANVLAAAYLAAPSPADGSTPAGFEELQAFVRGTSTRSAYPLGKWRELARIVGRGLSHEDPVGQMAHALLQARTTGNETLEALANQIHPLRNRFAHNVYSEAQAQRDLPVFEQVARAVLRSLRPLASWTLVTIERTEHDLYGEVQTVEYVDHTGPSESGVRRRVGLKSDLRLAPVVYLVRWREGVFIPLEPFLRRRARGNAFDLYWIHHLPRAGACSYGAVVTGDEVSIEVEDRRMPPRARLLASSFAAR